MATTHDETRSDEHVAPREAWDAIAVGYDRHVAPQETELANEALRLVGLRRGERFLDVAAGTGKMMPRLASLPSMTPAMTPSCSLVPRFRSS